MGPVGIKYFMCSMPGASYKMESQETLAAVEERRDGMKITHLQGAAGSTSASITSSYCAQRKGAILIADDKAFCSALLSLAVPGNTASCCALTYQAHPCRGPSQVMFLHLEWSSSREPLGLLLTSGINLQGNAPSYSSLFIHQLNLQYPSPCFRVLPSTYHLIFPRCLWGTLVPDPHRYTNPWTLTCFM